MPADTVSTVLNSAFRYKCRCRYIR